MPGEQGRISRLVLGTARYGALWELAPQIHVVADADLTGQVLRRTGQEFVQSAAVFAMPRDLRRALSPTSFLPDSLLGSRRGFAHRAACAHLGTVGGEMEAWATGWPAGRAAPVLPAARRTFSRIGARFCFGADAELLMGAEEEAVRLRESLPPRVLYLPRWLPVAPRIRLRRAFDRLSGRVGAVLARRLLEGAEDGPDLLGMMIHSSLRHGTPPGDQISFVLGLLLVATQEMGPRAAGWMMLCLARHPEWADRVAAEAAALPEDPSRITPEQVAGLRVADAFVRETLRMYPPNWMITRRVVQPAELGGYRLRPGTRLVVSPYLLHRSGRYWSEPHRFAPERWLAPQAATPPGAYLPFGAGPRLCPGAALASMELTLALALTARRHRLSSPADHPYRLITKGSLTPGDLRLTHEPR